MNTIGTTGGVAVLAAIAYGVYLFVGAAASVGTISTVADSAKCIELSAGMPDTKTKAKDFLIEIDNRLVVESTAANVVQGTAAVASAAVGRFSQDPRLAPELQKCLAELKRGIGADAPAG